MRQVILTGIRSNDEPTLGNYLGAIAPMVDLARTKAGEFQINMFVPDLHSFTTPIDHSKLFANTMHNLRLFVAAGLPIDNDDVFVYRQSFIPAHSELAWILGCFTGFGEASRMVEFKDKSARLGDRQVSVGLFNYPILMAADILLYGAEWVPVGEDQRQHLELARTLAERMNNRFGQLFAVPKPLKEQQQLVDRDSAPRIRSLKNPNKKMSKSINDPAGTILLSDNPADAAKKVMAATTDSLANINYDYENQPGVSNLLEIYKLLGGNTTEFLGQSQYGPLKQAVAGKIEVFLTDLQAKLSEVDEAALTQKLEASESKMNEIANATLLKVQKAIGLRG